MVGKRSIYSKNAVGTAMIMEKFNFLVYGVDNGKSYSDYRLLRFFSSLEKTTKWLEQVYEEEITFNMQMFSITREEVLENENLDVFNYQITEWPVDEFSEPVQGWDAAPWDRESNCRKVIR